MDISLFSTSLALIAGISLSLVTVSSLTEFFNHVQDKLFYMNDKLTYLFKKLELKLPDEETIKNSGFEQDELKCVLKFRNDAISLLSSSKSEILSDDKKFSYKEKTKVSCIAEISLYMFFLSVLYILLTGFKEDRFIQEFINWTSLSSLVYFILAFLFGERCKLWGIETKKLISASLDTKKDSIIYRLWAYLKFAFFWFLRSLCYLFDFSSLGKSCIFFIVVCIFSLYKTYNNAIISNTIIHDNIFFFTHYFLYFNIVLFTLCIYVKYLLLRLKIVFKVRGKNYKNVKRSMKLQENKTRSTEELNSLLTMKA